MNCVTIDPGLTGTGFSVWEQKAKDWKLLIHGSLSPRNQKAAFYGRAEELATRLGDVLKPYVLTKAYFEMPASWGGVSDRSQAVTKLAITAGILVGYLYGIKGVPCVAVPVNDWKGNLPGDICCDRVANIMGWNVKDYTDHDLDSVGLGLFLQGRF
jgi:hypothetical protein